jgi:uncharacterized protein
MRHSAALNLHRTRICQLALGPRVSGVWVFGSALRGDDVAGSDLDLLVEPTPQTTLMDIGVIRSELKKLLGWKLMCSRRTVCLRNSGIRFCAKHRRCKPGVSGKNQER